MHLQCNKQGYENRLKSKLEGIIKGKDRFDEIRQNVSMTDTMKKPKRCRQQNKKVKPEKLQKEGNIKKRGKDNRKHIRIFQYVNDIGLHIEGIP